jgi:hypothetical protein
MIRRVLGLCTMVVLCLPPLAESQGLVIDHKEVGCIVVGKYPKMNACFSPASGVARSRVYFRPEGTPSWYYVDMKSDQPCFAGVLPKPGKKLVGKKIEYYVEAQDKTFNPARTAEYGPVVVRSAQECKKEAPVAPFVNNATVAVFPAVPAGFVGGGLGTAAVVGIAAAGAAAAGTAAVVASNDDSTTTTTVVAGLNTTTTIVAATTTTTTTTQPRATNRPPFAVLTTRPDPPSGGSPLTVIFDLCRSTDPDGDPLSFFFEFGDGGRASGSCLESHTYTASFRAAANVGKLDESFAAEGCVVDPGGLSSCRTRTVNVTSPAPTTPPCPGGPTIRLSPPPPVAAGCPGSVPVRATTTNADSVQFCATPTGFSCFPSLGASASAEALPPTCVAGVRNGNQFSANLNVDYGCNDITARAQGCGGTASDGPAEVVNFDCGFRGVTDAARPGAAWASDLSVAGGRLQLVVNGGTPAFPGRGAATGITRLVAGENRVEAVLVETGGKAGLWRVEFTPAEAVVGGSLRVISGEAVQLGAASATFRLSGREGERIVFTFVKR